MNLPTRNVTPLSPSSELMLGKKCEQQNQQEDFSPVGFQCCPTDSILADLLQRLRGLVRKGLFQQQWVGWEKVMCVLKYRTINQNKAEEQMDQKRLSPAKIASS